MAPVIDDHELVLHAGVREQRRQLPVGVEDERYFVEAGQDDTQSHDIGSQRAAWRTASMT
jgi:hypothetical protein